MARLSHTEVQKLSSPRIGLYSEDTQVWQGWRDPLTCRRGTVHAYSPRYAGSNAIHSVASWLLCLHLQHIQLYNDGLLGPFSSGSARGGHGTASNDPLGAPLADLIGIRNIDEGKA